MKLTEQHIIKKSHPNFKEIDNLCFLSKNLYNSGLYSVRQHFFQTQEYLNKFKNISNFTKDKQKDYVALPAVVAQQTLLMVDENFQSFFKSLKAKKNGTYKQKVNIPKYLDAIEQNSCNGLNVFEPESNLYKKTVPAFGFCQT